MNSRNLLRGGFFGLVILFVVASTLFTSSAERDTVQGRLAVNTSSAAQSDPVQIAQAHVGANLASLGLTEGDIAEWVVSDHYATKHNGVTHVYFQQRLAGIRVFNGILNVNVSQAGSVLNVGNRFVPHLTEVANASAPQISAEQAVRAAASDLALAAVAVPLVIQALPTGAEQQIVFAANALSRVPIKARLQYLPVAGGARLVWDVEIEPDSNHYWHVEVDALNGNVIRKFNLVKSDSYKVYEWPAESPNHVRGLPLPPADGRTIVTGAAANLTASPFGWHDTNGLAGADTADTTGNNVAAQTDETNDDVYVAAAGEVRPSNAGRNFIYPIDLLQDANTYREAVVTNLFYWNNVIHDLHYLYGFDEAAGNFQQNNYGKGGQGNDLVNADAQDGSGTNNANMLTLPEGISPRMQMFIWTGATTLKVNSPASIAGDYVAAAAAFGPEIDATGITGDLQMVNSTVNPQGELPSQGCNPMAPASLSGKVAVIDRGSCEFGQKVVMAQNAGAIAAIIINVQSNDPVLMGPGNAGAGATIPSISIGNANGTIIKNAMATATVNATMKKSAPDRDSDLDNAVIIHEYTHGVSNRLTGGPNSTTTCLENLEQGGEGWSDWFAIAYTARTGDTGPQPRGMGTYVTFQDPPTFGGGIRAFPYSTDMNVNPQTYNSIRTAAVPHGVGAVWAEMLWEVYWNLIDGVPDLNLPGRGYRQNLYDLSQPLAGNQIAIRLVMDGMKMQPCLPTFVEARDAILEADRVNNGGAFQCHIWKAFAKRGLGVNAVDGGKFPLDDNTVVQEDFTLPCECDPAVLVNEALQSNGSTVLPSTQHASGNFPALAAINGDRTGAAWGTSSGGWNDNTRNAYPDVLEVDFPATKTINRINVFTLQNNWTTAGEPTLASPATGEGILDFVVQYCSANCGTATPTWTTVTGGNVTGNDKAMRVFTFTPVATSKIRVVVNNSRNNWSRIVEMEALGCGSP
jgi:extracellular elastinolytic metalloproteinase